MEASVTRLVRGHFGRVLSVAVFPGRPEIVTASKDRFVVIWDTDMFAPVAECCLPAPASCVACSPSGGEVVVGTANTSEIVVLTVIRGGSSNGRVGGGGATGLVIDRVKQVPPPTQHWEPDLNTPAYPAGVGGSGSSSSNKASSIIGNVSSLRKQERSPGRSRRHDCTLDPLSRVSSSGSTSALHRGAFSSSWSRLETETAATNSNADTGGVSAGRNRSYRYTGASCLRYSPSGEHLAVGCRNGSIAMMEVTGGGGGDQGRPDEGEGSEGGIGLRDTGRAGRYRRVAWLQGHSSTVLHLDWSTDGRFLQTCGQDNQLLHWEVLPPPQGKANEGREGELAVASEGRGEEAISFKAHIFTKSYLMRDVEWSTWSSTLGWPVQGVFPPYTDNSDVNEVDICAALGILAAADDSKTTRLLRFPVLRGSKARSYWGHSSHVAGLRFTVGVSPQRLITVGGMDSVVMQWLVEPTPVKAVVARTTCDNSLDVEDKE